MSRGGGGGGVRSKTCFRCLDSRVSLFSILTRFWLILRVRIFMHLFCGSCSVRSALRSQIKLLRHLEWRICENSCLKRLLQCEIGLPCWKQACLVWTRCLCTLGCEVIILSLKQPFFFYARHLGLFLFALEDRKVNT